MSRIRRSSWSTSWSFGGAAGDGGGGEGERWTTKKTKGIEVVCSGAFGLGGRCCCCCCCCCCSWCRCSGSSASAAPSCHSPSPPKNTFKRERKYNFHIRIEDVEFHTCPHGSTVHMYLAPQSAIAHVCTSGGLAVLLQPLETGSGSIHP